MILTFEPDFGDSGAALGWYDNKTDRMNINLSHIFIMAQNYHQIPVCDGHIELCERILIETLIHEWLHKTLAELVGETAHVQLDNLKEKEFLGRD